MSKSEAHFEGHPKFEFNIYEIQRWMDIKMLEIKIEQYCKEHPGYQTEIDNEKGPLEDMHKKLGGLIAGLAEFYGVSLYCHIALKQRWGDK